MRGQPGMLKRRGSQVQEVQSMKSDPRSTKQEGHSHETRALNNFGHLADMQYKVELYLGLMPPYVENTK